MLKRRWVGTGRRHRPVRVCEACRRPWPCPAEVAASGPLKLDLDAANEAVASAISAAAQPYLDQFKHDTTRPTLPRARKPEPIESIDDEESPE